jgi:TPR repeat protein
MAQLIRPLLLAATLAGLAACGGESETAGREDAVVGIASVEKPDPEAEKAAALAAVIATEKEPFDAALVSGDEMQIDALAEAGNAWALHHRALARIGSHDYMLQQGGYDDMQAASDKGLAAAQLWVGQRMAYGQDGYKLQPNSGLMLMEKAAAQGNIDAILAVASMYVQDAYMHDTRKARDWYKRAADLGSADAKTALDQMDQADAGQPETP